MDNPLVSVKMITYNHEPYIAQAIEGVLNVSQEGAYQRFCEFLDKPCLRQSFPWENKTADIAVRRTAGRPK